jgi:hypothetical protein
VNTLINVIIGFAAVYASFALIASWFQEMVATALSLRSKNLVKGIENLVDDPKNKTAESIAQKLLSQPSITASVSRLGRKPSYVSSRQFSLALTGILTEGQAIATAGGQAMMQLIAGINKLPDSRLKNVLTHVAQQAAGDYDAAIQHIEAWYDDEMDRISGWYTRHAQIYLFGIALILAGGFNLDAVSLLHGFEGTPLVLAPAQDLKTNTNAQNAVVSTVLQYPCIGWSSAPAPTPTPPPATTAPTKLVTDATGGATNAQSTVCSSARESAWLHAGGIIISIVALMLGAPFWFNLLSCFVNIRASGPPPKKSTNGDSSSS